MASSAIYRSFYLNLGRSPFVPCRQPILVHRRKNSVISPTAGRYSLPNLNDPQGFSSGGRDLQTRQLLESSPMREHGPWKIQLSEQMYSDPWIQLFRDQVVRPDGLPGTYATVHLRRGVCVLAVDDELNVHLTKEFHYAVGRWTIEGVSGGIEDDELPLPAAHRELAEELGIEAAQWTQIGVVDPFTSAILSPVTLYLAQQLTFRETNPEGTEQIEHVTMPLSEAIQAVRDGEITHAPTCVALLRIALDHLAK